MGIGPHTEAPDSQRLNEANLGHALFSVTKPERRLAAGGPVVEPHSTFHGGRPLSSSWLQLAADVHLARQQPQLCPWLPAAETWSSQLLVSALVQPWLWQGVNQQVATLSVGQIEYNKMKSNKKPEKSLKWKHLDPGFLKGMVPGLFASPSKTANPFHRRSNQGPRPYGHSRMKQGYRSRVLGSEVNI